MNTTTYPKLVALYEAFQQTDDYLSRVKQFAIAAVNKEIIQETLKNEPLLNDHLTGLIQMFKYGCKDDTYDKYLAKNIADAAIRAAIIKKADDINEFGYTGAGLNAVTSLTSEQLQTIKTFIQKAFVTETIEEAVTLCSEFDKAGIPLVKSGIYSPWLYYINPQLFPILNNSHIKFREWIDMPSDYPSCIKDFNELKTLLKEEELGVLDMFAHNYEKYADLATGIKLLNLNGKRLYKVSHGIFKKDFRHTDMVNILENNKWICIGEYTGKGAGAKFQDEINIGDFVYVCYGGDDLYCIGKIISDFHYLDAEYDAMIDGGGEWIYREIEPLYFPQVSSVRDLKGEKRAFMPSGFTTFYEVPKNQLDYMNDNIFIPKVGLRIIDSTIRKPTTTESTTTSPSINRSMNSILFGPPGTGKTFHSISHAVAVVENETIDTILLEDRELVKNKFDQYVEDGQIVFCTFHQSLSYEDFIEGIKPVEPNSEEEDLTYAVEDGIFKRLCTEAAFSYVQLNPTTDIETVLDFSGEYDQFIDSVNERFAKGEQVELKAKNGGNVYIDSISQNNNIWIKHINGERKYTVSKNRLSKLSQAFPDLKDVTNINSAFKAEMGGSNSSAYWAVLNAIRNQPDTELSKVNTAISEKEYTYEDKKGIIKSLKQDDYKVDNPTKFVLIIDEINRGNVSQIFGELITLIEEDKRLGKDESLKATLPYSKDSFGVPPNVFIIGTMNTADRSVEALDTALRRRFSFVPMPPKPNELKKTSDDINLPAILHVLNQRLAILKDNDHTIGHAWLWNVSDVETLKIVFRDKILPLLQEYFYNDYEKLGLVLGDAFFKPHLQVNSNIFATFTGGNGLAGQYDQSWQYELKPAEQLTISDFKSLENHNSQPSPDEE